MYFGSVTPPLKALKDRTGYIGGFRKAFAGKGGGPLVVARRTGQDLSLPRLCTGFIPWDSLCLVQYTGILLWP